MENDTLNVVGHISQIIDFVIYVLPLLFIVWRTAKIVAKIEFLENKMIQHEVKIDEDINKIASKHSSEITKLEVKLDETFDDIVEIKVSLATLVEKLKNE